MYIYIYICVGLLIVLINVVPAPRSRGPSTLCGAASGGRPPTCPAADS